MMGDEKCYENNSQETGNARDGMPFERGWTELAGLTEKAAFD